MRPPQVNYGWIPIETAPLDEDIALQVTDGRGGPYTLQMAVSANRGWLDQFAEGDAPRSHASEVEAVFNLAVSPSMTARNDPEADW
jgi:hypothetical protein